jgi:competence protein ComEC
MNGKLFYFSVASLLGVLCSFQSFLLFFFLAVIYIIVLLKYKRFSNIQLLFLVSIFLLFLFTSQLVAIYNKTKASAASTRFSLEYMDDPIIDGDQLQIKAKDLNNHEKYLMRYKIQSEQEKNLLKTSDFYGLKCLITGLLEKPKRAKNENAFNYRDYLERNSIFWLLESKNMPLKTCTSKKLTPFTLIKQFRFKGIHYIETHFPPEVAAISNALIYGDKSIMPPELLTEYQKIGISHLLAISGLHVSLLVGMIFFIGIRIGATRERMTTFLLVFLPVYAVLTGGSPSVVRAVVMIFLVMLAVKWGKRLKLLPFDALSLAFSLFLLLKPFVLYDAGFQLSFSVSGAIILSGQTILGRYPNNLFRMLMTTFVAQLSSLPILLFHFFGVSLLSIFINLLFIPLYSYLFLPGVYLLFLIQILFGKVPDLFMNGFSFVVQFSNKLVESFSKFSFANYTPGRPGTFFLVFDSLIILAIFLLWEQKYQKNQARIMVVLCSILLFLPIGWNHINPYGEVTVIDVGQGDSILVQLPFDQGNYLIDTGGTLQFNTEPWQKRSAVFETGEDVVVPFLKGKGITRIDKLILTHGDMDHIGGAFAVIKELNVKQIIMPKVKERSETENEIEKEAEKKKIQVVFVSRGSQWKKGPSHFVILSPEKNFQGDRNRGSVCLLASIGQHYWFFGGDLDQQGEEEIVKRFPNLKIDVLKVGHHGSKTSSSELFLMHYKPKVALISVGEKNRFGHPHQEVIEKLTKIDATIFRTDLQGEISYHFFNGNGTFFTFLP